MLLKCILCRTHHLLCDSLCLSQIQLDVAILSENDDSIMKMKQETYFNNESTLELKLKRKDINDWIDRSFGRVICMVPARAGSERLKLKNMRLIAGKPMIQYAIEKATEADVCDRVVVNSDSLAFADIAKENGVEFFLRPKVRCSESRRRNQLGANRRAEKMLRL